MICCCDPAYGSGSSGGGGGGETLAQTLVLGNTTSGTDIVVSAGDQIVGQTDLELVATAGPVELIPSVGQTALVGAQSILTTCSSAGGTSIVLAKAAGTPNGADQPFRGFTSSGGTVAITTTATAINLESAGGVTPTWAQTLTAGNFTGGTDPVITTGDELLGQTRLDLRSQGDGWITTIRAADGGSEALNQTRDVVVTGGNATAASAVQGGRILAWGGSGDGTSPGGTVRITGGTGGSASGTGGPAWIVAGQGGTPNGDGGEILMEAGVPQGFGQGGAINMHGGDATGNTGGVVTIRAGNTTSAFSAGVNVSITAGNSIASHGGDVVITGGTSGGAAGHGGDIRFVPTAQSGAGTPGSVFVGSQTIFTRASNLGGGAQVFAAKALDPSIDGARLDLRSIVGTSPIVATQNANDITLSAPTVAIVGAGSEIGLQDTVTGDLTFTQRLMTMRHSQCACTQMRINIAAGNITVDSRARSITAGNTTTIGRRSIQAQSTLGTNVSAISTVNFTTTSNTFVDITTTSGIVLNAGDWVLTFMCEIIPAA